MIRRVGIQADNVRVGLGFEDAEALSAKAASQVRRYSSSWLSAPKPC